jgi:RNA polymerase sigma-70 factor (ECF subfamily)
VNPERRRSTRARSPEGSPLGPRPPAEVGRRFGDDSARTLLDRVGAGDRDAFADLYDLTVPEIYGLIRRMVADERRSEAVTTAVYLDIWTAAPAFPRAGASPRAWLIGIVGRHLAQSQQS